MNVNWLHVDFCLYDSILYIKNAWIVCVKFIKIVCVFKLLRLTISCVWNRDSPECRTPKRSPTITLPFLSDYIWRESYRRMGSTLPPYHPAMLLPPRHPEQGLHVLSIRHLLRSLPRHSPRVPRLHRTTANHWRSRNLRHAWKRQPCIPGKIVTKKCIN